MISRPIELLIAKLLIAAAGLAMLAACSSSTSSSDDPAATVTRVSMFAAPSPAIESVSTAGPKTITTDLGDTVVINRAYLVIWSTTIETSCDSQFSAGLQKLLNNPLDVLIPPVHAHTTPTPTSTGEPHVIDVLASDNVPVAIGGMSPSVADYCGVDVDMIAADEDALDLPTGAGEPDMIGRTLYIEASFKESGANGGMSGDLIIDTGATLINRKLLLSSPMTISRSTPTASIAIGINYDRWFDGIDLQLLKDQTDGGTDPTDDQVWQLLQNVTASLHHI